MAKKSYATNTILLLAGGIAVVVSAFLFLGVYGNYINTSLFNQSPATTGNMTKRDCIAPEDRPKKEQQITDLMEKISDLYTDLIRTNGEISRMTQEIERAEDRDPAPSSRELGSLRSQLRQLHSKAKNIEYQIKVREDRIAELQKELGLLNCGPLRSSAGSTGSSSAKPR